MKKQERVCNSLLPVRLRLLYTRFIHLFAVLALMDKACPTSRAVACSCSAMERCKYLSENLRGYVLFDADFFRNIHDGVTKSLSENSLVH